MTNQLAVIPKGMNALSACELGALSAAYRGARRDCRKVMHMFWASKQVTETYRQMVVEFQRGDPLFTAEWRLAEIKAHR